MVYKKYLTEEARKRAKLLSQKKYYDTHSKIIIERNKDYDKRYKATHKKQTNKTRREWYKKNHQKIRDYDKKRFSSKKGKLMKSRCDKNYREKNAESIKQKKKEYYNKNRERIIKKYNQYREQNKEKIAQKQKEYHIKNRDKIIKRVNDYVKEHREEVNKSRRERMYSQKRRAKFHQVVHDFSSAEWLEKLRATNGICPECNCFVGVEKLTLDHIKPISKAKEGEVYTINDVQPLCKSCNSKKGNK